MSDSRVSLLSKNGIDFLKSLLDRKDQQAAESAAWVSVDHQHKMNEEMRRSIRWHQEQVNARARGEGCDIQPIDPDPEEGGVHSPTLINCTFNGDKAVQQISAAAVDIAKEVPEPPPVQPLPVQPPQGKPNWLKIVAATLGAVILGATLIALAWLLFGGEKPDPVIYEIIGQDEPFEIPETFTGVT